MGERDFGLDDDFPGARPSTGPYRAGWELLRDFPDQVRDIKCLETGCDGTLILKEGRYGIFYGCDHWVLSGCKGSLNCNKFTAKPLGQPADARTKQKRIEAHEVFDRIWISGGMRRDAAYGWLRTEMGLSEEDGHIRLMTFEQCEKVIELALQKLGGFTRYERLDREDIL